MRNHQLYLKHIFEAMNDVQTFIEGMDCEAFAADDKTASAAVLKFEIMGEAIKHVPEAIRQKYPQVPWQQIVEIRHQILYRYFEIDHAVIWDILKNQFPSLQPVIKQILKDIEKEQHDGC